MVSIICSILASLNLPAALEDLSGQKVPQSVIEKAQQIKDIGGIQFLNKLMNDLPELLQRNREILNEVQEISFCTFEMLLEKFPSFNYLGMEILVIEFTKISDTSNKEVFFKCNVKNLGVIKFYTLC